ncbi:MAG: LysR family transcriptional regulator [Burkholderiaceae bacterium]|nr:LysR family transcriptional regulator [Pseudomonadota bacterium]MBS0595999.1 LysR family transcriptional regulator [Pseudomonadota bacterium]MCO5116671.1 LysR family transcriptional regulator [Burkholderiaceae bacterium]MCP5218470.1 LysR family transcriptional regulator [Burkholderiaceae bacterium]
MNITIRQLQAFLALVELRNFTRAAAKVNLSQPAFSAMIRALEIDVGARLFHRDTRHVALTAEGQTFEGAARRTVLEVNVGVNSVHDVLQHRRGKVSLALLPSLAAGWLPSLLALYCKRYPGVEVRVDDLLSEGAIERVRQGHADFAIVTIPVNDGELQSSLFCTDHFELVCRSDHRLALAKRLALKDLAGERFIYQVRHSIVGRYLASKLPSRQTEHFMEVHQLATVIGMVRAGLGIAAIPELNLYHFHYADLVRRDLRLPGLERRIYLLQPRGQILSVAAQALWELMHQHKPDHTLKPHVYQG